MKERKRTREEKVFTLDHFEFGMIMPIPHTIGYNQGNHDNHHAIDVIFVNGN